MKIAIVISGGVVQEVVSDSKEKFTYRVIDQDEEDHGDFEGDQNEVDIEAFTREQLDY